MRLLQLLLPERHALREPVPCRLISEFAGIECALLGRNVRVSFVGAVHDALVLEESKHVSTVLLGCGIALTVPTVEIARGMSWDPATDLNPHTLRGASAKWFDVVLEGPRAVPVHSIAWLPPTGDDADGTYVPPPAAAPIAAPPPRSESAVALFKKRSKGSLVKPRTRPVLATGYGSVHQRVRCFEEGEDQAHPHGPPRVVYCKFHLPYLRLFTAPDYDGYAREAAAYRLLARCSPAVAPRCHHSFYHESSGSYVAVLDDHVQWVHWHGAVGETRRHRHTGDLETVYQETLTGAKRIAACLAALHSRYLVTAVAARLGKESEDTCVPRKDLRSEMVHEQVFEAYWLRGVSDPDLRAYIQQVYAGGRGGDIVAPPPPQQPQQQQQQQPATSSSAVNTPQHGPLPSSKASSVVATPSVLASKPSMYGSSVRRHLFSPPSAASRLTLVHGDVCREHVLMHPDPRAMPSVVLVDWKRSGIAPLEVDLLQLYLTLPLPSRAAELTPILEEYVAASRDLRPEAAYFTPEELMCYMRDTCLVLAIGGPCLWNDFSRRAEEYQLAHTELAKLTGVAPLHTESRRSSGPPATQATSVVVASS